MPASLMSFAHFGISVFIIAVSCCTLLPTDSEPTASRRDFSFLGGFLPVSLTAMNGEVINLLETLQPTGYGNPEPVFVSRAVQVKSSRTVGAAGADGVPAPTR